ncbi:hypothetical protein C3Y89_25930 [Rhizobium sp. UPM1132]|nr:hypothetical protein [Rhizobium ruizarguesonis]NKQ76952.1 hypothetical protein [Rhizobium ruizarguesonis]
MRLLLSVDNEMIYRLQQDATAINLRMGSGGRLTSRRCHEITWPSSGRRRQDVQTSHGDKGNDCHSSTSSLRVSKFGMPGVLSGPTSARLFL